MFDELMRILLKCCTEYCRTAVVILGARSIASQVGLSASSFIYQYLLADNGARMACV